MTSNHSTSLEEGYFSEIYASDADPWRFTESEYEHAKYDSTVAALSERYYERGLEVGCSIGVLTERLAKFVRALTAIDITEQPLRWARDRNREAKNITFLKASFPAQTPPGPFDLIVLSEVLYYLDRTDLAHARSVILDRLTPGGDVILVHWLGKTDYPLSGDEAAEGFIALAGPALTTIQRFRREHYRLDVLRRVPPVA